jgi:D-alanine-D-alanine ligase
MELAIVFGGASYEHEISIVSAIALKEVLRKTPVFIFLDAEGGFYHIPAESMRSDHFSGGGYRRNDRLHLTHGGFVKRGLLKEKRLEGAETVLNLVHGAQGEDGTLAALFDFYGVPYVGPRKAASVISYDKRLTKLLAEDLGVRTIEWQVLTIDGDRTIDFDFPVIVKPLRLGSSIGVGVVRDAEALEYALDTAFEFDDEVLVEPFIEGIQEYNVAGCRTREGWVIGRIEAPQKRVFLDFEQKYLDFARTGEVAEAEIDESLKMALKERFERVYGTLFNGALIRCDFFVAGGEIFLNEINPIPGSMANYLFDDFEGTLERLAANLPEARTIRPDYAYIDRVQSAKGPKSGRSA